MFRIDLSSLSCGNLIHTRNGVQCFTMYWSFIFLHCLYVQVRCHKHYFFQKSCNKSFISFEGSQKKDHFYFHIFFLNLTFFYFVWSSNNMEKRIVIECCDYDTATQFHLLFRFTLPQELFVDPQRFLRQCDQH